MTEREKQFVTELRNSARQREEAWRRTVSLLYVQLGAVSLMVEDMNLGLAKDHLRDLMDATADDFGPPRMFLDKMEEVSK